MGFSATSRGLGGFAGDFKDILGGFRELLDRLRTILEFPEGFRGFTWLLLEVRSGLGTFREGISEDFIESTKVFQGENVLWRFGQISDHF